MKKTNIERKKQGSEDLVGQASSLSREKKSGITGFQPVKEFRRYRRNLPHWEQPGSYYFITFRTGPDVILPKKARDIVLDCIKFHNSKKYNLYACVVMSDHIHLIIQPLEKENDSFYSLAEIMHSIKSFSSKEILKLLKSIGKMPVSPMIWRDESFDRIIRDEKEYLEKMSYVVNNSLKKSLARSPEEYKWLYVKGWLNDDAQARMPVPPASKQKES